MGVFKDLTGQIFNGIKVIQYEGNSFWRCKCLKCGKESGPQVKKHGCHCSWKNTVNEQYFETIDTKEKAYFLGFLWADGYNSVDHMVCKIDLQARDRDFLVKLKDSIRFSGNICSYVAKKGKSYRPEEAIVYRIAIKNERFIRSLDQKGVKPHREELGFPFEYVSDKFFMDFIRGYFDGNGCCSIGSKQQIMISICGGAKITHDIGNILAEKLHVCISYNRRHPDNISNLTLRVNKKLDKQTFLNALYQDAPVYLDRKYDKYLMAIELLK